RNQSTGDSDVRLAAEQPFGIEHAESEAKDGRYRRQRDVALAEVQLQTDDLTALPNSTAHHACVRYRSCVRSGSRARQGETGNFLTAREAGQVVILLLLGTVVIQQLGGAQ